MESVSAVVYCYPYAKCMVINSGAGMHVPPSSPFNEKSGQGLLTYPHLHAPHS